MSGENNTQPKSNANVNTRSKTKHDKNAYDTAPPPPPIPPVTGRYSGFNPGSAQIISNDNRDSNAKTFETGAPPTLPPPPDQTLKRQEALAAPLPANSSSEESGASSEERNQARQSPGDKRAKSASQSSKADISNKRFKMDTEMASLNLAFRDQEMLPMDKKDGASIVKTFCDTIKTQQKEITVADIVNIFAAGYKLARKSIPTDILHQISGTLPELITELRTVSGSISLGVGNLDKSIHDMTTHMSNSFDLLLENDRIKNACETTLLATAQQIYQNSVKETKVDFINNYIQKSKIDLSILKTNIDTYKAVYHAIIPEYTVLILSGEGESYPGLVSKIKDNMALIMNIARSSLPRSVYQATTSYAR
ncbi:MAG: phosphoprotein [Artemisia capillaris nucleorhabdovirus 1]|uniref:Phosphoprotein n=1 Tax=Artemisia capillaris nucleorhabdovirus 1 TaxID=2912606 RepID=A0AAX2ZMF5_9RHAB|nr:MAG: phosphoprotein [Artemisia capillaris nucleorhabdovirus 1]UKL15217.1 MAG: phosphoprotein [Artemisia capillaris nucleorhabdovirus 1]